MWAKDDYQEHMLGYLGEVRAEVDRLTHSSIQQCDLSQLRDDLQIASERLWRLIESSDSDWESFRYPLEARCDELLGTLRHMLRAGSLKRSGTSFRAIGSSVYLTGSVVQREHNMTSSTPY